MTSAPTPSPFTLGILREGKRPADLRTPLTPDHCKQLLIAFPHLRIEAQRSPHRAYTAEEYEAVGVQVVETLGENSEIDLYLGVKEVPVDELIPGGSYLFFSHTIKAQSANATLLATALDREIRLMDYELLTHDDGSRVAAFGHFAGIVGAHNGLLAYGRKTGEFLLTPAHASRSYADMAKQYDQIEWPSKLSVVVAGTGRTSKGAVQILNRAGFKNQTPREFLDQSAGERCYTVLRSEDMYAHKEGKAYNRTHFHTHPEEYESRFSPYAQVANVMMNCIFWREGVPRHFSLQEMASPLFKIQTIADISCDINGSVPATVKGTTIFDPTFGWHLREQRETEPFRAGNETVDIMAVDNLPCELPRDASTEFGQYLVDHVMPRLIRRMDEDDMIMRATIARAGALTPHFIHLEAYAEAGRLALREAPTEMEH